MCKDQVIHETAEAPKCARAPRGLFDVIGTQGVMHLVGVGQLATSQPSASGQRSPAFTQQLWDLNGQVTVLTLCSCPFSWFGLYCRQGHLELSTHDLQRRC